VLQSHGLMPLDFVLWHHGRMQKRSKMQDADDETTAGGIVGAVTQDLELTVEQAEEAAKKAAHKAAVALGIAKDEEPAASPSSEEPAVTPSSKEPAGTAEYATPSGSSAPKPKE
jgi:hypothetical protein